MRQQKRRRGFQLAELVLSIGIFALVGTVCFYAAASGFRIFANASGRQVLQRDARAIFTWLQRDVGLSNLVRCASVQRDEGGLRRDGLGVAAMDSWQQPLQVDTLGLPSWNRMVTYIATRDPRGLLLRQLYSPAGRPLPLAHSGVVAMLDEAVGGTLSPLDQRRLSGGVESFAVEISESRNTVVFDLVLKEATVQAGGGQARQETLQVQTTIFPRNTWPRL